ncbi:MULTISPECIES: SHOCT domain-containing protein [Arthrobacter]|uniref:SHOCT domain-containing protein n=2 Tax=Arthrobacter TaxID=1663 RepID=A0ABU9KKM1_9MICC|nr:SHOCT domain-containing protein [Arthrobacter sp. YJM1]MDP5227455.1 SHOCT domain-containing protein [Arthrobacter sp. YJM1]
MFTTAATALPAFAAHGAWAGGFFPWFLIFPLFWFVLFFVCIFFFARRRRHWMHQAGRMGAEAVLRERYARGEIDETEYRQRLEVLRANS